MVGLRVRVGLGSRVSALTIVGGLRKLHYSTYSAGSFELPIQ